MKQKCTLCNKDSIPGLLKGHGKCQYHYNLGQFGKDWADYVEDLKAQQQADELKRKTPDGLYQQKNTI